MNPLDRLSSFPAAIRTGLAVVMVAFGLALLFGNITGVDALARTTGGALLSLGALRVVTADRSDRLEFAGASLWVGVGLLGLLQPGFALRTLATIIGTALVAGSLIRLYGAARSSTRDWVEIVGASAGACLGTAAVVWPTVTVLVLASAVGAYAVLIGVATLVRIARGDRPTNRGPAALVLRGAGLVVSVLLLVFAVSINRAGPDDVSAFYDAPEALTGTPGTLVRSEVVEPFVPGARAQRVLYETTARNGDTVTASGLVIEPEGEVPPEGRPMIAFTHGTIGIARNCSPSALPGDVYGPAIPGIREFLDAGFVIVAPDYAGLGSEATTGYLVGADEAQSTLDSVRATINGLGDAVTDEFVVFGESQGGHAALFTGEYAAEYAPELDLIGVAAAAPATDLESLFKANLGTPFGDILASYALVSWVGAYLDLDLDDLVDPDARPAVERLADKCIQDQRQIIGLFPEAAILNTRFLGTKPWENEVWSRVLEENTPGSRATAAPVLVLQGEDDPLVLPRVQSAWVEQLCAQTSPVEYRTYPGVGHLDAGHATASDVAAWAQDLLAGQAATSTC